MLVDGCWVPWWDRPNGMRAACALTSSSTWNVTDVELARGLIQWVERNAMRPSGDDAEVDGRSCRLALRDGIARLLTPYL